MLPSFWDIYRVKIWKQNYPTTSHLPDRLWECPMKTWPRSFYRHVKYRTYLGTPGMGTNFCLFIETHQVMAIGIAILNTDLDSETQNIYYWLKKWGKILSWILFSPSWANPRKQNLLNQNSSRATTFEVIKRDKKNSAPTPGVPR